MDIRRGDEEGSGEQPFDDPLKQHPLHLDQSLSPSRQSELPFSRLPGQGDPTQRVVIILDLNPFLR